MKDPTRREFVIAVAAGIAASALPVLAGAQQEQHMYGLIAKMNLAPGQRETVAQALLEGVRSMPGCLSYIVAHDPSDPDAIWITEAWDSRESHQASLKLPAVQQAITRARPHIRGFGERFETTPVGGQGLGIAGWAAHH
jgi:quinol monooxygenase YgiN